MKNGLESLKGRLAFVTGGARGIGKGIAEELLKAGARVVIGDIRESDMDVACRQIQALGPIFGVQLDVSDTRSIDAAVASIHRDHGPIDVLVNNAGIGKPGLFVEDSPESILKTLAVDLVGAVYLTRLVLPDMLARGWGRIANMSSMMGFSGSPGFAVYSTAKFGLTGFSQALERELRRRHVRVSAVLPPSVKTQAFREAKEGAPTLLRWSFVPPVSVEQVARRTVHGLARGKRRIYCSSQSFLAALSERMAPRLLDFVLMRMFRAA